MAVGDFVTMSSAFTGSPRKPLFGRVVAEAAGPPAVASVQWFNGKRTNDVDQEALLKMHDATAGLQELLGKWAQLVRYLPPSFPVVDDDAPKSPAAAGIVHTALGLSVYDAADPEVYVVYMSMMDGRVPWIGIPIEDDDGATQLSTHTQRRDIG